MFDITKLAVKDTSDLHLRDAEDNLLYTEDESAEDRKPMTITLYGPGSKAYAKAQSANQNRMIDKLKKRGKTEQSPEEKAKEQAEFLAACTVSFNNFDYKGLTGHELFKAVYSDTSIGFIAEQVNKHLGDWGNFTANSAKS